MSRRVLLHPGTLYCSGCGHELQSEHGSTQPMPLQWIYACTFTTCPQFGERLIVPVKSMVVMSAPKEV